MINFVLSKDIKNYKEYVYTIYYLTKGFNTEVKVSYSENKEALNVYYGVECNRGIYIPYSEEHEKIVFNKYKDEVYASFDKELKLPFKKNGDKIEFYFDIIFLSKFLLVSEEEYEIEKRDDRERFIAGLSLRKEKVNIPFFDVNSFILMDALKEFDASIAKLKSKFEIFLTHDVDSVNSRDKFVFLHNCKSLLCNRKEKLTNRIGDLISDIILNRHLQIENYMDIEKKRNAKSEFYFIAGVRHRLGKRYDLNSIKLQVEKLRNSNDHIIGMHTNYFSYKNRELMQNEINEIEEKCDIKVRSCRDHYLRFETPTTWEELSSCNILSDSTVGYSDINGFRAGICNSYVPFNYKTKELIDIIETPLVVMDGIVMEKDLSFDDKWKEIKYILDYVIKYNGTASVLFHQRVIYNDEYKAMYEKIMDYVVSNNGKFVLSSDFEARKNTDINNLNKLFLALV